MGRFDWLEVPDFDSEKTSRERFKEPFEQYDAQGYLQLASQEFNEGRYESALKYYSRALHLDRNNSVAWVGQVKVLIKMEELGEAKVWIEKALSLFPKEAELLAAKALLFCRSKLYHDALAYSDTSIEKAGNSVYLWLVRGEILLALNNLSVAGYCFDKAVELDKDEPNVFFEIGEAYFNNKLFVKAVEYFKKSLEVNPSNYFRWFKLGKAYEGLLWYDKAKSSYEKVLELNWNSTEAKKCLWEVEKKSSNIFYSVLRFVKKIFL